MARHFTPSSRYMWQLDTLRAVAAGMVILSHWVPGTETFWFNGHVGVQLFFVISGFLITGILLDARKNADCSGIPRGRVVGWGGISMTDIGPYAGFLLNLLVLVILSSLSWHCFEKKINAFKRYFPYLPLDRSRVRHAARDAGSPDVQAAPGQAALDRTEAR
jgi:peptidoglycan/LPS O-acetylase OafA/YrhL